MNKKIIEAIKEKGPLTGAELIQEIDLDPLMVWRACRLSEDLVYRIVGTRYLRLD